MPSNYFEEAATGLDEDDLNFGYWGQDGRYYHAPIPKTYESPLDIFFNPNFADSDTEKRAAFAALTSEIDNDLASLGYDKTFKDNTSLITNILVLKLQESAQAQGFDVITSETLSHYITQDFTNLVNARIAYKPKPSANSPYVYKTNIAEVMDEMDRYIGPFQTACLSEPIRDLANEIFDDVFFLCVSLAEQRYANNSHTGAKDVPVTPEIFTTPQDSIQAAITRNIRLKLQRSADAQTLAQSATLPEQTLTRIDQYVQQTVANFYLVNNITPPGITPEPQ